MIKPTASSVKSKTVIVKRAVKLSCTITEEDYIWLDALGKEFRKKTGEQVSRSELIRSALKVYRELNPDLQMKVFTALDKITKESK